MEFELRLWSDSGGTLCPPTHRRPQRLLRLDIQGHVAHERQGDFQAHVAVLQQRDAELPILLPRSHSLGEEQVENVQTVPDAILGIAVLDAMHPLHPVGWQAGRLGPDALRVVAVGFRNREPSPMAPSIL